MKLYRAHKQQAAVRKWRGALKNIRQREDKFALLGYLYQAYMDWGKYRYAPTFDCCFDIDRSIVAFQTEAQASCAAFQRQHRLRAQTVVHFRGARFAEHASRSLLEFSKGAREVGRPGPGVGLREAQVSVSVRRDAVFSQNRYPFHSLAACTTSATSTRSLVWFTSP